MAPGDRRGQVGGVDLESCRLAVVAHPQLTEPEGADGRLGAVDRRQQLDGDRRSGRDPARQAGGRRLVPRAQAEPPGGGADVLLAEPGGDERELGTGLGGGPLSGPMVVEVVRVDPEDDGGAVGGGDRREHVHQRRLAVVATLGVVDAVGGPFQLVGVDRLPAQPPFGAEPAAVVELGGGERRRDGGDRQRRLGTERVGGDGGEERRVGSPAERHDDPFEPPQLPAQGVELGVELAPHTTSLPRRRRSSTTPMPTAASSTIAGSAGARIRWAP